MHARSALGWLLLLQLHATAYFLQRPVFPPIAFKSPATAVAHAFYYPWYGNPTFDGKYKQWDHEVLAHPEYARNIGFRNIGTRFSPPDTVASRCRPNSGLYSCRDPATLRRQLSELKRAHVPVIAVSWIGPSDSANEARMEADKTLDVIFDAADSDGNIKVAFHLEDYEGRTAESVVQDIKYLFDRYRQRSGLYRDRSGKPWFYVHQSQYISAADWHGVLATGSTTQSLRKKTYDSVVMGTWLEKSHGEHVLHSGFDGFFTGAISQRLWHGANPERWPGMVRFARENKLIAAPTVGPGHDDLKIRPWNGQNYVPREWGRQYDKMFAEAVGAFPDLVTVMSFNGWTEGTQVEAARPGQSRDEYGELQMDDYGKIQGPFFYLDKTRYWVEELEKAKREGVTYHWGSPPVDRRGMPASMERRPPESYDDLTSVNS